MPITIGTISHGVAFPNLQSATYDNDVCNSQENESKIVPVIQSFQDIFPKLPDILQGIKETAWRNNKNRLLPYVPYIEYCHNET